MFHTNTGDFMNILITGAASGIGFDVACQLARNGNLVYATVRTEHQVIVTKKKVHEFGFDSQILVFKLDITVEEDRKKLYWLDIDCLINNAAIGFGGSLLDLPVSKIRENFEVNVFSTIEMIQTYAGHLFLTKKPGKVIIMSSLAGLIPLPFMSTYCATKASLLTFATALRNELWLLGSSLTVKLVEPGIYLTGFNQVMIDNKVEVKCLSDRVNLMSNITKGQSLLFQTLGRKRTDSIVRKIVKATNDSSHRLLYRAPFLQVLGAKLYMLLWK